MSGETGVLSIFWPKYEDLQKVVGILTLVPVDCRINFAQLIVPYREFQDMAECLLFQNSFRLGARMMLEIMHE